MRIRDLTGDYLAYVLKQDKPILYESAFPQLFEHYYAFWANRQPYSFSDLDEIARRRNLILERLPILSRRFGQYYLDLANIEITLFVGHGTSNGHAFYTDEHWVVWLPIEAYHSVLATDVFVSHELAHALHYQQQPEFYFRNEIERTQVFRQLVTEGIATLTSKIVLGISSEQALWADYLPAERIHQWYEECSRSETELFRAIADKLESSDEQNYLFSFSESDNVLENRAGYYAGLVLLECCMKHERIPLKDLFGIGKQQFLNLIRLHINLEPAQQALAPDGFAAGAARRR